MSDHNPRLDAPRTFGCVDCGRIITHTADSISTGYGRYGVEGTASHTVCFACIGEHERTNLATSQTRATLYLTKDDKGQHWVSNWPGSFKRRVPYVRKGYHNMARYRYDFQFAHAGFWWSGTQYGDNTQIAHCRRTKERTSNAQ